MKLIASVLLLAVTPTLGCNSAESGTLNSSPNSHLGSQELRVASFSQANSSSFLSPWTENIGKPAVFDPIALTSGGAVVVTRCASGETFDCDDSVFFMSADGVAKSTSHMGVSDPLIQAPIELSNGNVAVLTAQKLRIFSPEGSLVGQTQFSPALLPRQIGAMGLLDADHLGLLSTDDAPAGQGASTYWVFKNSGQLEKAIHVGIGLCGRPWSESQDHLDLRALSCGRGTVFKVSLGGAVSGVGFTGLDISMDAESWAMEGGIRAFSSNNHLALLPMTLNAQPIALPEQITNCGNARWIKLDGTHVTGQCDGSRAWENFLRTVDTAGNFTTELRVEADDRNGNISVNNSSGIRYFSRQGQLVWSDFQGVVAKSLNLCGKNCEPYRWTPLLNGRVLVVDESGGVLLLDEHTPEFRLSATSLDEVGGQPSPYLIKEDRLVQISSSQVLSIHNSDSHLVDLQNWTVSELPFLSGYDPTLVGKTCYFFVPWKYLERC